MFKININESHDLTKEEECFFNFIYYIRWDEDKVKSIKIKNFSFFLI